MTMFRLRLDKKRKIKSDNKGFTLVEVIAAMSILVIVAIPIMSSLSRTASNNAASRTKQKTTTVSQNIVENLKTCGLKDVASQFRGETTFNLLTDLESGYGFSCYEDNATKYIASAIDTFKDDKKNFGITNLRVGLNNYDCLITYTKKMDINSVYEDIVNSPALIDVSSQKVVVIDSLGRTVADEYEEKAAKEFQALYASAGESLELDAVKNKMKNEIDIEVKTTGSGLSLNYEIYNNITFSIPEDFSETCSYNHAGLPVYSDNVYPDYIYVLFTPYKKFGNQINIKALPDRITNLMVFATSDKGTFNLNFDDNFEFLKKNVNLFCNYAGSNKVFANYSVYSSNGVVVSGSEKSKECVYDVDVKMYEHTDDADKLFKTTCKSTFSASVIDESK